MTVPAPDTPGGRLRVLLDNENLLGRDPREVAENLTPLIPLGDAAHWMRGSLVKRVRDEMKDRGLVITHTGGSRTGVAADPAQLPFDDFVHFGAYRMKQMTDSEASLRSLCEVWLAAHPGCGLTVDDLMAAFAA